MIPSMFRGLLELGLVVTAVVLFLSLTLAVDVGYRLGRLTVSRGSAKGVGASGVSTLTAGMLGLLAFTLSLSINFAQNRYEARRALVLAEANAIGTAWLRTKLVDGEEGSAIAAKIEDYAKVRLDFTVAASDGDVPALLARTNALRNDMWQTVQVVAHRSPNTVTTSLVIALNDMFDSASSQRFAYESRVPTQLIMALYSGALLTMGALGYQFGLAGRRQIVVSSLLLVMWSGGMMLMIELSQPRMGNVRVDAEPLVWAIQGFSEK